MKLDETIGYCWCPIVMKWSLWLQQWSLCDVTIVMSHIEINKAVSQWLLTFNLCVSVTWPLTCAFHIPCTHTPEIIDMHRGMCDNMLNTCRWWGFSRRSLPSHRQVGHRHCWHGTRSPKNALCPYRQHNVYFLIKSASSEKAITVITTNYNGVIMGAIVSQITSLTIVFSTVYLDTDKKTSKLRVTGLCAGNSPHKWPVTRKMFAPDDVIMKIGNDQCRSWQYYDTIHNTGKAIYATRGTFPTRCRKAKTHQRQWMIPIT